nr:hypothetical protein [Paenibacillus sp. MMS18-CY102]
MKSIEQSFNDKYNFEALKNNTIEILKRLIRNSDHNFLQDEKGELPAGLEFSDLQIEYIHTSINPKTGIRLFYYDVDYNMDGEFSDEYFSR